MPSVSPIGIPNTLGILKNDGTGLLSWTTIQPGKNAIINGDCRVNQRGTAYTLIKDAYTWDASDLYGPDRHEGMATGTAVSAGTWGQTVTATAGHSGYAFTFAGVTLTGTGILYHRHRIAAKDACEFKNQIASFGCYVWQDTGASHNYTIYVRKANAADNFSAVTEIGHSAAQSVPGGGVSPGTFIKFEGLSMGDCSNGIEVEIKNECGAITTNNFEQTELQFEKGSVCTAFEYISGNEELWRCLPYCIVIQNTTGGEIITGFGLSNSATYAYLNFSLLSTMRAVPTFFCSTLTTLLLTDYSSNYALSNLLLYGGSNQVIRLQATSTGLTAGHVYTLALENTAFLGWVSEL